MKAIPAKLFPEMGLDTIAESSSDYIMANYWITLGLPREYVARLKAIGKERGFKKAPVAAAARLFLLLSVDHPEQVREWADELAKRDAKLAHWHTEHKGCDPADN